MRYIDAFRQPDTAAYLLGEIDTLTRRVCSRGKSIRIMEVCGTHTMAIARHAIRAGLPASIELISGPGCPVCVTDPGYIDAAHELAENDCIVASFGDMLRVPGSSKTLADAQATGAQIEICYSPAEALRLSKINPHREVVFLGVGFETTTAPLCALIIRAAREGIQNFSLLTGLKRIVPALWSLLENPVQAEANPIDGLLLPAHVSAVIGVGPYIPIVTRFGLYAVIAGFEPLDILYALVEMLQQMVSGKPALTNHYNRVVQETGNPKAMQLINLCLNVQDGLWRGLGPVPQSTYGLKPAYRRFDAVSKFGLHIRPGRTDPRCGCNDVIRGMLRPTACRLFASTCTPEHAVGPCMISAEGSCSAAYRYERDA